MASNQCIVRNLARLSRNIRAGTLPTPEQLPDLAADWAVVFAHTEDPELDAAVFRYLGGSSPWWPMPGQVLALTPCAMLAATLGTDADADRAWSDFGARGQTLLGRGTPPAEVFDLPTALDRDPHRHAAMWAGLVVIGGWDGWRMSDVADRSVPSRFRAAYVAARQRQRVDPVAVRGILTVANRLIEAAPNAK